MKTDKTHRKPFYVAESGNVSVPVCGRQRQINDKKYSSFVVTDHSKGKRKLWTFADLTKAKARALEIAGATATGERDLLDFSALNVVPTSRI